MNGLQTKVRRAISGLLWRDSVPVHLSARSRGACPPQPNSEPGGAQTGAVTASLKHGAWRQKRHLPYHWPNRLEPLMYFSVFANSRCRMLLGVQEKYYRRRFPLWQLQLTPSHHSIVIVADLAIVHRLHYPSCCLER